MVRSPEQRQVARLRLRQYQRMITVVRGHRRGRDWSRVAHGLHVQSRQRVLADRLPAWNELHRYGAGGFLRQ